MVWVEMEVRVLQRSGRERWVVILESKRERN